MPVKLPSALQAHAHADAEYQRVKMQLHRLGAGRCAGSVGGSTQVEVIVPMAPVVPERPLALCLVVEAISSSPR